MKILTATTKRLYLPKMGHYAHFMPRSLMGRKRALAPFHNPTATAIPATTLPVDSTGAASVSCPMDGNDTEGDCGEAMAAHVDNILTFGQGKPGFVESTFDLQALLSQYRQVSGGDNGLSEDMVVGQIWNVGIAGNRAAIMVDHLDFDVTNVALTQFCIDQFYAICMAWSVPDAFINGFGSGTIWPNAMTPNPENGHFTPLADVGGPATPSENLLATSSLSSITNVNGFYRLWTWGTWCWVSPAFVASVQPQCFVVFSPRQFNPTTGYDSKGRHITTQAALWQQCGGKAIAPSVISAFPPISGPTPTPPGPTPTPPGPTPTPTPTPPAPNPIQQEIDALFADVESKIRNPRILAALKALQAQIDSLFASQPGGFQALKVTMPMESMTPEAAFDWTTLLAFLMQLLQAAGPIVIPVIETWLATLGLPAWLVSLIESLLAQFGKGR